MRVSDELMKAMSISYGCEPFNNDNFARLVSSTIELYLVEEGDVHIFVSSDTYKEVRDLLRNDRVVIRVTGNVLRCEIDCIELMVRLKDRVYNIEFFEDVLTSSDNYPKFLAKVNGVRLHRFINIRDCMIV